jgi:hypothetical protein
MSGETHTFEITPELLEDIISLMKEIEWDLELLQRADKECHNHILDLVYHKDYYPDMTVRFFKKVFEKIGLTDVIASKIKEDEAREAAALELKARNLERLKEISEKANEAAAVSLANYNKANEAAAAALANYNKAKEE